VRLDVVPAVRELAPQLERRLCDLADAAREDRAALDQLAEQALRDATVASGPGTLGLDLARLAKGPRGLLPHVLRRSVERVRRREGQLYRAHIEALCDLARGRAGTAELHLPGATATREYGTLHLRSSAALQKDDADDREGGKEIVGPGCYRVGRNLLTVDIRPVGPPERDPWAASFDAADIAFPLAFRRAGAAESIVPFGMTGHKLLSDLLGEARVPRSRRAETWVLTSRDHLLWVAGVRRSAHHPVRAGTQEMVVVRVTPSPG
jgi:tRNA(Ile)-lysidine synthase